MTGVGGNEEYDLGGVFHPAFFTRLPGDSYCTWAIQVSVAVSLVQRDFRRTIFSTFFFFFFFFFFFGGDGGY